MSSDRAVFEELFSASPVQDYLQFLHRTYQRETSGKVATYIPELAKADPNWFGICIVTMDGHVYEVGDSRVQFTIQSISKPFVYGLGLEDQSTAGMLKKIGVEPTGDAFNSISLRQDTGQPFNPMINAGAIAATSLIRGATPAEKFQRIIDRAKAPAEPIWFGHKSAERARGISSLLNYLWLGRGCCMLRALKRGREFQSNATCAAPGVLRDVGTMEWLFELLFEILLSVDFLALIGDVIAWILGRENRIERREARRVGLPPPPRDGWNKGMIWFTAAVVLLTGCIILGLARP